MKLKLISWNVNGLRAVVGKGFGQIFNDFDADYVCLQETKLQEGQISLDFPGYKSHWNYADRKGYSGTVTFTRRRCKVLPAGIGVDVHDHEGRVVTLDCGKFYLVNVYSPNSQNELARLPYRQEWEAAFLDYIKRLDAEKPVVICGDMNVAHEDIDLKNPRTNHHSAGFTDEERDCFRRLLGAGFVDSFRRFFPDKEGAYTWWSYRYNGRAKNVGWRIDYFLVSERIADALKSAEILSDVMGSDHCPVSIILDI